MQFPHVFIAFLAQDEWFSHGFIAFLHFNFLGVPRWPPRAILHHFGRPLGASGTLLGCPWVPLGLPRELFATLLGHLEAIKWPFGSHFWCLGRHLASPGGTLEVQVSFELEILRLRPSVSHALPEFWSSSCDLELDTLSLRLVAWDWDRQLETLSSNPWVRELLLDIVSVRSCGLSPLAWASSTWGLRLVTFSLRLEPLAWDLQLRTFYVGVYSLVLMHSTRDRSC